MIVSPHVPGAYASHPTAFIRAPGDRTIDNPTIVMKQTIPRTRSIILGGLTAAAFLVASPMHAQIGSGWSPFSLSSDFIDYEVADAHHQHSVSSFSLPSCFYTLSGSTETFGLTTSDSNRIEHDTSHHFNTGTVQFEGYLNLFPGISQQSVVQDFGGGSGGPICMIKGYGRMNGSLVVTRNTSINLITNMFSGITARVNVIHDTVKGMIYIYINGVKKWEGADAGSSYTGSYNFKYGLYGTFNASTKTVWNNVKFFQGGTTNVSTGNNGGKFEAEDLAVSDDTGDTIATNTDGGSNGAYVQYFSGAVGDYVQFTVPNIAPGTYTLSIGVKKNTNRGIVQTQVNKAGSTPSDIGSPVDLYGTSQFTEVTIGTWTIGSTSDKWVKFLVTGKNSSSSGYNIAIDYIKLTPQ